MGVKQSLKAAVRPPSHQCYGDIDFYGDSFFIIYIGTAGGFAKVLTSLLHILAPLVALPKSLLLFYISRAIVQDAFLFSAYPAAPLSLFDTRFWPILHISSSNRNRNIIFDARGNVCCSFGFFGVCLFGDGDTTAVVW
jgi:hypothetical protein